MSTLETEMSKESQKERVRLPDRRLADTITVTTDEGHKVHLSIGYDPMAPTEPREIFYAAGFKSGSQLEFQVQDFCIFVSRLLQFGMTPKEIGKSLAKRETADGQVAYASISGMIIGALTEHAEQATKQL